MTYINGFHGTTKENSKKILMFNRFQPSRGDRHWLGDGCYFYEESVYAFRWIADIYKKRFERPLQNVTKLRDFYSLICVNIEIDQNKIFDMTTFEHHDLFDTALESIRTVYKSKPEALIGTFSEGVVLNFMFNDLKFDKDFDVIVNVYYNKEVKYADMKDYIPHQKGFPEKQICVKNIDCIKSLKELTDIVQWNDIWNKHKRIVRKLKYKELDVGYEYNVYDDLYSFK